MRWIIYLFVMNTLLPANTMNVADCSCAGYASVGEAFQDTPVILHAKVLSTKYVTFEETINPDIRNELKEKVKDDQDKMRWLHSKFIIEAKVEILHQYKGNILKNTTTIYTTRSGASCGYTDFEAGKKFIIYAYLSTISYQLINSNHLSDRQIRKEGTYWTNHCTRTQWSNKQELDELDKVCDSK